MHAHANVLKYIKTHRGMNKHTTPHNENMNVHKEQIKACENTLKKHIETFKTF